jgi:hypothetical protein
LATRDEINDAVREMLATVTGVNVGLAQIPVFEADPTNPPEGWPGTKYVILYPLNTSSTDGSMNDGEEEQDMIFQATCVGDDARRAGWTSSKVHAAFLALSPGGGYLHDITLTGHDVTMRSLDSLGAIVPSGEDHFASADTYRLRVCRS